MEESAIKSIIIRQGDKKIIHLKKKPFGVESEILQGIGEINITVIYNNGERMKISNQSNI